MTLNRSAACLLTMLAALAQAGTSYRDPIDVPAPASRIAAAAATVAVTRTPGGRLVGVGRHGVVLLSDDGSQWRQAQVPVSTDLVALCFPTAQQGWAVGHGGVVLHTADGGASWHKQLDGRQLPALLIAHFKPLADAGDEAAKAALQDAERYREDGPGRPLLAVWFEDERNGIVVGAYNLALRTADGGASWQAISARIDNPQGMHLYAVAPVGAQLWIAGEQGLLLKGPLLKAAAADSSAARFSRVPTPYAGTFFGVAGQGEQIVAFGLRGHAVRSTDGGASWADLPLPTQNTLTGGSVLPDGRLVLVSMGGEVLTQTAAGAAFTRQRIEPPMAIYAVSPAGPAGLLLAGPRGVRLSALEHNTR